ncbi:biotin--[acetyl-CoA-carboxylase] ligase [Oscillospiraceae bacterium HV4-5-C5C]|nr:biotin--[acetyl-CoA-carboxylase] ligase [Oscillospiraceae bacterium HV4-5-C5C]
MLDLITAPDFNRYDLSRAWAGCLPACPLQWFDQVDSTNNALKRQAQSSTAVSRQWYAAAASAQTAGRGRQGRSWTSAAGRSICCSLMYLPDQSAADLSALTLIAGLACCEILQTSVPGLSGLGLKWPNDLMIGKQKLGGILCETGFSQGKVHHLVIGFGINVNQLSFPPDLADRACSLLSVTGQPADPNILAAACAQKITTMTSRYLAGGADFEPFRNAYKQHCLLLQQPVEVQISGEQVARGLAVDIASDGSLVLACKRESGASTRQTIRFGEAHIGKLP